MKRQHVQVRDLSCLDFVCMHVWRYDVRAVGRHTAFASHMFCLVKYVKNEHASRTNSRDANATCDALMAERNDATVVYPPRLSTDRLKYDTQRVHHSVFKHM